MNSVYPIFIIDKINYRITWTNLSTDSISFASSDILTEVERTRKPYKAASQLCGSLGNHYYDIYIAPLLNGTGEINHFIEYWTPSAPPPRPNEQHHLDKLIHEQLQNQNNVSSYIYDILKIIQNLRNFTWLATRLKEGGNIVTYEIGNYSHFLHAPQTSAIVAKLDHPSNIHSFIESTSNQLLFNQHNAKTSVFTKSGGFWSNCIQEFLLNPDSNRPLEIQYTGSQETIQSLALIPIKSGINIVGLLQIGDSKRDYFTTDDICHFEHIALNIGLALDKIRAENKHESWIHALSKSPFPIIRLKPDGTIVYTNPMGSSLLGGDQNQGMVNAPHDWYPYISEAIHTQNSTAKEILRENQPMSLLFVPLKYDGDVMVFGQKAVVTAHQATRHPLDSSRKAEDGIIKLKKELNIDSDSRSHSIYDQNVLEQNSQQFKEKYYELVDLLPYAVCVVTQDNITYVNKAGLSLLGATYTHEILGQSIWEFIHPDYTKPVNNQFTQLDRKEERLSFTEMKLVRLDGNHIEIEASAVSVKHQNEHSILVVLRNISDRKHQQEILKQSKARLANTERMVHLGNWKWDISKDLMEWSHEMYHIFGVEESLYSPTYESFRAFVDTADRESLNEIINNTTMPRSTYSINYRIHRPDSQNRIVYEQARIQYNKHHKPIQIIGTIQDVTEQKEAENKLVQYQQQLRSLTADLQLSEERERRRIAADLHDSIGQILAFAIREIGLLKKSTPESISTSLQQISDQLSKAIDQTRTLTFDLSPSILYDMGLQIAVEELAEQLFKKGQVRYRMIKSTDIPRLTEPVSILLYRSIRELLFNIVKHAQASFVEITFCMAEHNIQINIRDNGKGFDLSRLNHSNQLPTGFGLFSIRERLNYIGGYFKINSSVGKGTMVRLVAPMDTGTDVKDYTNEHTNHISG